MARRSASTVKREELFASAFVALQFKARDAAISIGISPPGAAVWASGALKRPNVQDMIARHVGELIQRHDLSIDKVVMELKKSALANMRNYVRLGEDGEVIIDLSKPMNEDSGDMMAAVQSIRTDERVLMSGDDKTIISRRTQIKLYDRNSALDNLLRFLGGYAGKEPNTNNNYIFGDVDARTQVVNLGEMSADEAAKSYQKLIK